MISVASDRQDRQLGRMTIAEAEAFVRARGGLRMRMSVVKGRETLIAWYQRRGDRETGETMPNPYEDHRFDRPLPDDEHFVMREKKL